MDQESSAAQLVRLQHAEQAILAALTELSGGVPIASTMPRLKVMPTSLSAVSAALSTTVHALELTRRALRLTAAEQESLVN